MHRVLLVDDEPLILAGIKSLVDWRAADCEIVGTARNGKQALTAIENLRPDIVIADIVMPVMGGIELLTQADILHPDVVFIMLTNLQEFDLARESLRHRAVDYLVKTQLEAATLLKSLDAAKEESLKRQKAQGYMFEQKLTQINEEQLLINSLKLLMVTPGVPDVTARAFQKLNVLGGYMLLAVQFKYPEHISTRSPEEFDDLLKWEYEVVDEIVKSGFSNAVTAGLDSQNEQILVLVWGEDLSAYDNLLENFYKRLLSASSDITGIVPCLLATDVFTGKESLPECRSRILKMTAHFYLTGASFVKYDGMEKEELRPLGLTGVANSLKKELNGKNAAGCKQLLERVIARVKETPHEKSNASWLCTELYSTICEALSSQPDNTARDGIFFSTAIGHEQIKRFSTRDDIVRFLTVMGNELNSLLQRETSGHAEIIDRVKHFVRENVNKRITLHDTANAVCLSSGYLSAIFKKHCGENFMDFVNRCKIEKACELLKRDDYLIGQVSDMLSFENAYYFTKVFKRYMGITPSEYRGRV